MATEEPITASVEVTIEPAAVDQVNKVKEGVKSKKAAKEPKAKKVAAPRKAKTPSAHPPYFEMIQEAITSLKERTGSSQYAIAKFIEEKHKNVPSNFKKLLLVQLKKLVASQKLSKIKNSYKIPSKTPSPTKKKPTISSKPKPKASTLKKKTPTTPKPKPVKAKPALKPKATPVSKAKAKAKAVTPIKAKAAAPRPKPKERVVKAARTSTRTAPGRKAPVARAAPPPKKAAKKKAPAKSPVKKAATRRGKK